SSSEKGFDGANCGGSLMTGVSGASGTVRSITRMPPVMMPPINCAKVCEWFMFDPIVDTSSITDYSIPPALNEWRSGGRRGLEGRHRRGAENADGTGLGHA